MEEKNTNLTKEVKLDAFRMSKSDTGSTGLQIASLTKRLSNLTEHFKKHKKDFHSRMGLIKIISQRKRLLSYLKSEDFKRYQFTINQLGLRK